MQGPDFDLAKSRIAILGLGLMGGSLALGLRGKCAALYGIDPHQATLDLAMSRKIVDRVEQDPARLLPDADVIILSAPVPAILTLLEHLPAYTSTPSIVMDLGSTKRMIVEAMSRLPDRFDPIGGHPICGKEQLSIEHAEGTLYHTASFVLTPLDRTTSRALSAASQIIEALGARAVRSEAAEHDRLLAFTSHLPFLLSSALVHASPQDLASFIGPGYKSTGRLAGTPSSMMLGVLNTNRDFVLNALRDLMARMSTIEDALISGDFQGLEAFLKVSQEKAQAIRQ